MFDPETKEFTCDECNDEKADLWYLGDDEFHLCDKCATDKGFCPGCGGFAAGEFDDFIARHDICFECWQQLKDDIGEW